jgi:N-acetylmuramoyl-L-alanine amidase
MARERRIDKFSLPYRIDYPPAISVMNANPNNTGLEPIHGVTTPVLDVRPDGATRPVNSGHEALQALLAFSSLHQQIRERGAHGQDGGRQDSWRLKQFVLDEVLQLVAERAVTITGADGVAIAFAESDAIVCRASAGTISPDRGIRLDPKSGFSGACLVSGQIVRCDDSESDHRVDAVVCQRLGARSMVAVPLSAKQTVIGLIEAFSTEPYGFNDSDVRSLSLLAELILAAIRPEEEDRLAEISKHVVSQTAESPVEPEVTRPAPELDMQSAEPPPTGEDWPADMPAVSAEYTNVESSRPGLGVVIALVLFALVLGTAIWWRIRHVSDGRISLGQPTAQTPQMPAVQPKSAAAVPSSQATTLPEDEKMPEPATPENIAAMPQVTGIRHWSSADSSTVVIDLQDQVQYEAHRLPNPDRIYFDLHDTRLVDELNAKTIEIGDALLERVRIAQPVRGVTRVVLETKGASNFSVSLEPNPYRLEVEVRKIGVAAQPRAKVDLFAPQDQNASDQVSANPVLAQAPKLRIVLDAGHGGWDLGTVGRKGLLEKDLVLDIVARLGKLVEKRLKAQVIYTRGDDQYLALEKRAEIANLSQADLFMSIHANYSDYPSARGVETYYTNTYSSIKARPREATDADSGLQNVNWTNVDIRAKVRDSHRFAADVQRSLYAMLAAKNPGLPNRGVKEAQYVVLTGTTMPAILAEISFVSSPTDENNLQSSTYRQQIAEALYQGVAGYAEESHRVKMASVSAKPSGR